MNMKTAVTLAGMTAAVCAGGPVPVIFDTDMSSDCDDAGALAVLHALADLGEARILAVAVNAKNPSGASAAALSAINVWYGRPDIPIGTDKDGCHPTTKHAGPFVEALRDGFPHGAKPDDQMPDAVEVYRRALAGEPDGSVVICSVGALSNLEDLLRSPPDDLSTLGGADLIRAKVRLTVIMGGGFPRTAAPETNIKLDPAAAVTVVNEWPGPILWQGYEVGRVLITGAELQSAPETNPVRRAFELTTFFFSRPALQSGKPSHDQAAVLIAVRGPQPDLWTVVDKGRVVCDSDGHTEWKTDRVKPHRYVCIKAHPSELETIIGDLMAKRASAVLRK